MDTTIGQRVYACIWAWHGHSVCWRNDTASLSSIFHIFSWLPGKVRWKICRRLQDTHFFNRVLLATIKNLAQCPCPWCLIQISQIPDISSCNDQWRRENIRIDSVQCQADISLMRSWIFECGYRVDGSQIKDVLGKISALPIIVRYHPFLRIHQLKWPIECLFTCSLCFQL